MRLGKVGSCRGTLMGHTGRMRNVHSWKLLNQVSNTGMPMYSLYYSEDYYKYYSNTI
jgi:hypothetical protein